MPSYENDICQVCGEPFREGDDIVTCPVCGTPHHRACYASLGHCVNEEKHESGFEYESENAGPVPEQHYPVQQQNAAPGAFPFFNAVPYVTVFPPETEKVIAENPKIENADTRDIAATVRSNTDKFLPKFVRNGNISWNWAAFIFGPYYLAFRRMIKESAVFLAVKLIIMLVVRGIFADELRVFSNFINSNYSALTGGEISDALTKEMTEVTSAVLPISLLLIALNVVLHIIIALFADKFYRAKVLKIISKVDSNIEEGGMFADNMPPQENAPRLSQQEMKRFYLGRIGGTSMVTALFVYFAYELITSLLANF